MGYCGDYRAHARHPRIWRIFVRYGGPFSLWSWSVTRSSGRLSFCLVGIFEEFFFRGYLQFTLSSGMGFWPAALLLSLAFGAVHLRNPGEGPVGALSVFVIGMFLCFTLRRTGTLWFAIGFHAAYDFGETYLYSVPDSGIVMPGHLLASSFHGPAWLTGGTVGPEGSVFDFVIMAIAFVVFDRVYRSRILQLTLRNVSTAESNSEQVFLPTFDSKLR